LNCATGRLDTNSCANSELAPELQLALRKSRLSVMRFCEPRERASGQSCLLRGTRYEAFLGDVGSFSNHGRQSW
jgi:hypothetical protein